MKPSIVDTPTPVSATGAARWRPRIFYGWLIVGSGMVIQAMVNLLLGSAFGSYVAVLQQDYGWSKTTFSGAYAMQQIESGLLGPIQGTLIDRFGPRATMRVGVTLFGLGFFVFSRMDSILTFYLAFVMIAVGSSLSGYFPITVTVVNWFVRRRATALGLVSSGMAIGGLLAPLVAWSLSTHGWRATAFVSGVVIMAIGYPITGVMRHTPEAYGYKPDGDTPADPSGKPAQTSTKLDKESPNFTARQALRTRAFWFIALGHASALLVVAAVNVHLVSFLKEGKGYSVTEGAAVFALLTGASLVGQIGGGLLGDRFNKRKVVILCMLGHAVALLLLAYSVTVWMVVLFALIQGLAWGTRGPLMAAIRADYFGRAAFGAISGYASLVITLGTISGPMLAAILADQLGDYRVGFTVLALLAGLGSIFWILAKPPHPPRQDQPAPVTA
ncbi:MAG: MFS transporter [Dehalococcoidia bacterium]